MLTLFTAAAVLAACAVYGHAFGTGPERKDAFFWGGRIRLTAPVEWTARPSACL